MAFCHVAKLADTVQDEAVKELCLTMYAYLVDQSWQAYKAQEQSKTK